MEATQNGSGPPKEDEQAKRLRRVQLKGLNEAQVGQGAQRAD